MSVLQDVSRGVYYLHTHNPPIILFNITTGIILLTSTLTAKVGGFSFAQEVSTELESISVSYQTSSLLPVASLPAACGLPFDIFAFGAVICHIVTQATYGPLYLHKGAVKTDKFFVQFYFKFCHLYLDHMSQGPLKQLAIKCIDYNPVQCPSIFHVCKEIDQILKGKFC